MALPLVTPSEARQLMSMMGEDVARMQQAVTDNMTGTITQLTTICQWCVIKN